MYIKIQLKLLDMTFTMMLKIIHQLVTKIYMTAYDNSDKQKLPKKRNNLQEGQDGQIWTDILKNGGKGFRWDLSSTVFVIKI